MMHRMLSFLAAVLLCDGFLWAAETMLERSPALGEPQLREHLRKLQGENREMEKLRLTRQLLDRHSFSSLQVKAIAAGFGDDSTRLEFAVAAYARTVDPENFYEVYDAFKTFSKVMRLHDRIRAEHRPSAPVQTAPAVVVAVSDDDLAEMVQTIGAEGIESTRQNLAREIIGAGSGFSSRQIRQIIELFSFESTKLELAKFAFDHVIDPNNYYLVNKTFNFASSKDELSRYIATRKLKSNAR